MDVEWKAFLLNPGIPVEGIPNQHKEGEGDELTGHLKQAAEEAGLMDMKEQAITPNSNSCFEASEYAKDKGKFDEYHKAAFKAYWEKSENIGVPEVQKRIFEVCNLDWEDFSSPDSNGQYAKRVEAQLMEANTYGLRAVPAFILDRYLLQGAQPYEVFQQAMNLIQKEREPKSGLWIPGED